MRVHTVHAISAKFKIHQQILLHSYYALALKYYKTTKLRQSQKQHAYTSVFKEQTTILYKIAPIQFISWIYLIFQQKHVQRKVLKKLKKEI